MSDAEIREAFRGLVNVPVQVKMGTVQEVDPNGPSCTVKPENEPELLEVRLKAGVDGIRDGIIEIPEKGSTVLVGIIENDADDAFVLKCSKVKEVLLFGGENGGLIIWPKLQKELEKHKKILDLFLQVVGGPPVAEAGNGAPSAFQRALAAALQQAETGNFTELENPKVKH